MTDTAARQRPGWSSASAPEPGDGADRAGPTARGADRRYWPGLDGMRALAVAAVVAYHLAPGALPGGFLGVDVFFVISGYLITTLLVGERARAGTVALGRFWLRRVRRLYPAVVALVVVLVPVCAVWAPAELATARPTLPMTLVYATNWWFIYHHVPYFQQFGPPPLLLHLWSLAIEEQYYLVWPPVLLLALRWWRPRRVAVAALVGALASAAWMAVLSHGGASVDRVYFGSDTHAEGLLLGSALGLVLPPGRLGERLRLRTEARAQPGAAPTGPTGPPVAALLTRVGAAALAGLLVLMVVLGQGDAVTWDGGLLLAVALAGAAVVVAAEPGVHLARWLASPPLRWLGTRSYAVYLWHWPIIVLTDPGSAFPVHGVGGLVVRLGTTAGAAEASYRFVERPWRRGTAQAFVRRLWAAPPRLRWTAWGAAAAAVVALVVVTATISAPPPPEASIGTATAAARQPAGVLLPTAAGPAPASTSTGPSASPADGGPVLAIGDSVMLAAAPALSAVFGPAITVDAVVGRQVSVGLQRLTAYRAAGRLQGLRALVIGLGSNGPFTPADLDDLRLLAAGVPLVVLVNVRVPDPWETESDMAIDSAAALPGYRVVDWYTTSADGQLLWPDGVHPDPAGQQVYAQLVAQAVTGQSSSAGS